MKNIFVEAKSINKYVSVIGLWAKKWELEVGKWIYLLRKDGDRE